MHDVWYWLSTPVFTCVVEVHPGGIVGHRSAVIVRRFWAQSFLRLLVWCEGRWGGQVRWEALAPHGTEETRACHP